MRLLFYLLIQSFLTIISAQEQPVSPAKEDTTALYFEHRYLMDAVRRGERLNRDANATERAPMNGSFGKKRAKDDRSIGPGAFRPRWGAHLMPLSLLNFNPRLRVGVQRQWRRLSWVTDLAYGAPWLPNVWDEAWNDGLGYRFLGVRPELRYHLKPIPDATETYSMIYLGLELAFTYFEKRRFDDHFFQNDRQFFYEEATQQRGRNGGTLKIGMNANLGRHFYLDAYLGIGAVLRQVRYVDAVGLFVMDQVDNGTGFEEFFTSSALWRDYGDRWLPELTLGIRVGGMW